MKRQVWIAGGIVAVLLIAAVATLGNSGVPVRMAVVQEREIREFVDDRARTHLADEHLITMPFDGIVEPAQLVVGQTVEIGQSLGLASARELQESVAEAEAAVERLQAAIDENDDMTIEMSTREQARLFNDSMRSTVAAAQERVMAGTGRVEYARTRLSRVESLFQTGAETEEALDAARLAHNERRHDHNQDKMVEAALRSMMDATSFLPRIITEQIARKGLSTNVMKFEQKEAEARLRLMRIRREMGQLKSPVRGVVLERVIGTARFLRGGTTLFRIGELEKLEIEMDLLSEEVASVRAGQPAEIYGPAVGVVVGSGIAGRVKLIHPSGFTKLSSLGVEQQRVTVVIEFVTGQLEPLLKAGLGVEYRVRARVFTATKAHALAVPRSAVFRGGQQRWSVFVVRRGRAQQQQVEVGLSNDDFVEIVSGLEEGEKVIIAPESSLESGARVRSDD